MWCLDCLGMKNAAVFGGTVGDSRKCPPTPNDFELLVLAEKAP